MRMATTERLKASFGSLPNGWVGLRGTSAPAKQACFKIKI